jgi:mono/diheme cytochrome c family protein
MAGKALFAVHCSFCHSLSGSPSPRQQGGDLKGLRLPRRELLQFAAEMPVVHGPLNPAQLRAVVDYVRSVEDR